MQTSRPIPGGRIGEEMIEHDPVLIGTLPEVDPNDPAYKLLSGEFKPWDGSAPILFTPDLMIKLAYGKMTFLMQGFELSADEAFALTYIHRFLQGRKVDPIEQAVTYQSTHRGVTSLFIRASEDLEVYDPRIIDIGLGYQDTVGIND